MAVPRFPMLTMRRIAPAVPIGSKMLTESWETGTYRLNGSADNWLGQLVRCVLNTCRPCCPEEYAAIANIDVQDRDTWLTLLRRLQVHHNICYTPSSEELSIVIQSPENWP